MQRQDLSQEALDFVAARAAYHTEQADGGADDDLDPQHRRNRAHVLGPYCRVQRGDDVVHNGQVVRVIGAARGEGWFYGLLENPWSGNLDAPMDGQYITDRAPADPSEDDPLPIFLPKPVDPFDPTDPSAATEPEPEPEAS